MKRPSNIQKFKPVDPKLGIKSSLPKSKSTIALVILLWLSNDKKYEIEYSETDGDKITISENCYDKLIQYLRNNIDIKGDSEEDIMNYVNENQLFHSQLESLIVALELVWRIASIKFKDSNKADSAERTGKKRFEKILSYTNNIDLFDTLDAFWRLWSVGCLWHRLLSESALLENIFKRYDSCIMPSVCFDH